MVLLRYLTNRCFNLVIVLFALFFFTKWLYISDELTPYTMRLRNVSYFSDSTGKEVALESDVRKLTRRELPPSNSQLAKMYPDFHGCATKKRVSFSQKRNDYWVLVNYIPASADFGCDESITYTTHSEYYFLDNLKHIVTRWQGPVSMAVYASGTDFDTAIQTILFLRSCWVEDIKKLVTFHLYYHVDHAPDKIPTTEELLQRDIDCTVDPFSSTKETTYRKKNKLIYPVNVARNAARLAAQTYFVFASDVELYPSVNIIPEFFKMLENPDVSNTTNSRVYVFPIFEVKEEVEAPTGKNELLKMLQSRNAILFHKTICSSCHTVPGFSDWLKIPEKSNLSVVTIGKRTGGFRNWEPIYIGTNREPLYDERFSWEGKSDKMAQMFVMCVKDYEFHILDNAFLVHRPGIKVYKADGERDAITGKQNNMKNNIVKPEYTAIYGTRENCVF